MEIQDEKYYITENIFRLNNKLYYQNRDKKIKLNKNNWFKFLKDYGWVKIPNYWKSKIDIKKNYFAILDCGGDGDCLFHCISEALNKPYDLSSELIDTQSLRNIVSQEINENNFDLILESYKTEKENKEFQGEWDPYQIKNIEQLQKEIQKCGNNFWGDHILLQLIQKKLNINIIIFEDNIYNIYDDKEASNNIKIQFLNENNDKNIILYYISNLHYQLIGYFDGNIMKTSFNNDEIPSGINCI